MSITLGTELANAQNEDSRHPIVEIISSPTVADIPLVGSMLSNSDNLETDPVTLALSNNSVVCIHTIGNDIKFIYTDPEGLEFTPVDIAIGGSYEALHGLSMCELANGNIGLIYIIEYSTNYYLRYRILTPTGGAVANGEIASWPTTTFTSSTAVSSLSGVAIPTNILTGGTASASTTFSGCPASGAVDNNLTTRWNNTDGDVPGWWQYDLGVGNAYAVTCLRLYVQYEQIYNFILQGSNNDSDWTSVYSGTMPTGTGVWREFTFANATEYRYYRLYFSDTRWANWLSVSEVQMLADIVSGSGYQMVYCKFDGSDYHLVRRTSADFITWTGETQLTIPGPATARRFYNPELRISAEGDIWLWFDHVDSIGTNNEELRNVYYSISQDGGTTWGTAVAITSYDLYSTTGIHPFPIQKTTDTMTLLYTLKQTVLVKLFNNDQGDGLENRMISMKIDYVNNRLVVLCNNRTSPQYPAIFLLDLSTWEFTDKWNQFTVPALTQTYWGDDVYGSDKACQIGTRFIQLVQQSIWVDVFDIDNETLRQYNFANCSDPVRVKNVSFSDSQPNLEGGNCQILFSQVDEINNRLWMMVFYDSTKNKVGYINLLDAGPEYTFHTVYAHSSGTWDYCFVDGMRVYPEVDYLIIYGWDRGIYDFDFIRIFNISTGALYKEYRHVNFEQMPAKGAASPLIYYDGCVYFQFGYDSSEGEVDKRGLCKIHIASDTFSFHRPTWATLDDYHIIDICVGRPGELIVLHNYGYGVSVYNIASDTWIQYNSTNVPGFTVPDGSDVWLIAYDEVNENIIVGSPRGLPGGQNNIFMFPRVGSYQQTHYYTGVLSGSTWTFTYEDQYLFSLNEYDAVAAIDPNNPSSLYVFWQTSGSDIKWSKEGSDVNLGTYLLAGEGLSITKVVNGDPNLLEFSCSHGYLFDPHNANSILKDALAKGRKLTVRWGERISGANYWQNAGVFYVAEIRVSYERGKYTDVAVKAKDMRLLWWDNRIWATQHYEEQWPENVISDLLQNIANLLVSDIDLPNFDSRVTIEHQWIDCQLSDVLTQICERFGYFLKIDVDNHVTAGKISDSNTVNHVYADSTKLISFEPDDTFSDFTNRVTVIGQEKSYIEVIYPEERITQLSGTVGWWGCKKDFHVPYSQDESRTCVSPRLVTIEEAKSLAFSVFGDIDESITYVDPARHYCTVTIHITDLTLLMAAAVSTAIATVAIPDFLNTYCSITIRAGTLVTALTLHAAMTLLSAICNYQYEVWATPVGRIRRSIQSTADDLEFQRAIGQIVEKRIEEYMCYTVADCAFLAELELMVVRLQRKRAKIKKIAHLQDEEGDTIQIPHPYTGQTLDIFITDLKRTYKKAEGSNKEGYFIDEIQGWVL